MNNLKRHLITSTIATFLVYCVFSFVFMDFTIIKKIVDIDPYSRFSLVVLFVLLHYMVALINKTLDLKNKLKNPKQ